MACSCWDVSRAWVFRLREEGDISVVRAGMGGAWGGAGAGREPGFQARDAAGPGDGQTPPP